MHSWGSNGWVSTFLSCIRAKGNENSPLKDLNSGQKGIFSTTITTTPFRVVIWTYQGTYLNCWINFPENSQVSLCTPQFHVSGTCHLCVSLSLCVSVSLSLSLSLSLSHTHIYIYIYVHPFTWAVCDTNTLFLERLIQVWIRIFHSTKQTFNHSTKQMFKKIVCPTISRIAVGRLVGFLLLPGDLGLC